MRVLFVIHQFFPEYKSGTEKVTLDLARMMQKAGHYVHVLTCKMNPPADGLYSRSDLKGAFDYVYDGIPITCIPRSHLPLLADSSLEIAPDLLPVLERWMRAHSFNLVHVLHSMRMATVIHAAHQIGLPYFITLTDFFLPCVRINLIDLEKESCNGPNGGQRCAQRCLAPPWTASSLSDRNRAAMAILEQAAERIVPSEYVANCYRAIFPGLDFRVIPHGLDLLGLIRDVAVTEKGPDKEKPLRLGYIGTLIPQKGPQVLVQALARIPDAALSLSIAGSFPHVDGFESQLRHQAERDPRISLLGQLDKLGVARLLGEIDLLCLPSLVPESYSLILREAAALGVPALVSELGAQAEFIKTYGSGALIEAGNIAMWAERIAETSTDRDLISQWQKKLPLPMRIEEEAFFYESLYRLHAVSLTGI